MSDYNSSLPVRTEQNGDVAAKIVDGTITSQALTVDAAGKITVKLDDATGTGITSQANGGQRALDVGIDVAGVQIDPRQIRALTLADVVTVDQGTSPWVTKDQVDGPVAPGAVASFSALIAGQYNATPPTLTDTQQAALQVDANGRLLVDSKTNNDTNYGTVGANTLRTAAEIGNATGAADFNFGTVGAQTLRTAAEVGNATGTADFNYGAVGAQTLRVAAEPGNSTGAADFNNGATGAQTLRVAANLAVAGANVTTLNPVPVTITSTTVGTEINDYKTVSSLAANATDNHDYAITAAKTFKGRLFWATGSGKIKAEVQISADGTTFVTKWVGFNSTATPNIAIGLDNLTLSETGTGSKIRIIITNRDNQAQDVYSTISGTEV